MTRLRFLLALIYLGAESFFFQKLLKGAFISLSYLDYGKVRFGNILKQSFKGHKNSK